MRGCGAQRMLGGDLRCRLLDKAFPYLFFMFPDEDMWQRQAFRKASTVDEEIKSLGHRRE